MIDGREDEDEDDAEDDDGGPLDVVGSDGWR